MLIRTRKGWELPESAATPEAVFFGRRRVLQGIAAGGLVAATGIAGWPGNVFATGHEAAIAAAKRNPRYVLDRALTDEKAATTYNNFYEFGSHKYVAQEAQKLKDRPWQVKIDGMVKEPKTIDIDALIAKMPLEERLYRHRCVEAWAMAVPWTGFPMAALVAFAEPLGSAKYVRLETFHDAKMASGQRQVWYPWPYVEGLTMAEATNELAFMATGVYGKTLPKQMGAPMRIALPWKYGFKSIKSIVRVNFTDQRPTTFWEAAGPKEYGFWANVNPDVAHPRWSQKTEELLGLGGKRVPTQLFNGYGEFVAHLYKDMAGQPIYF
jgi:sulfoxide reductase catalytic subunit YedY